MWFFLLVKLGHCSLGHFWSSLMNNMCFVQWLPQCTGPFGRAQARQAPLPLPQCSYVWLYYFPPCSSRWDLFFLISAHFSFCPSSFTAVATHSQTVCLLCRQNLLKILLFFFFFYSFMLNIFYESNISTLSEIILRLCMYVCIYIFL